MQALKDLPQIEAITESSFPFVVPAGSGFYPYLDFLAYSPADDAALTKIDRPRILDGRMPGPDAVDEVAVLDLYADEAGLQVGDEIELESFHPDQLEPLFTTGDAGPPAGPRVTVRVTGIIAAPTFLSESVGSFVPRAVPHPRLRRRARGRHGRVPRAGSRPGCATGPTTAPPSRRPPARSSPTRKASRSPTRRRWTSASRRAST